MKFSKVFKVFKKGAKAASKKGKKGAEAVRWPSGTRIGVFGHANCGKSVYFTVLNEECKISKNLQISVTDTATAGEFLANYRSLWGLGTASEAGTVVDFRGEKKFPNPTRGDKILKFTAIVDRKKKMSIVAYDYDGKAVSISSEDGALSEKVIDFMSGCDGLLFFYDPKILGAELESQARVASFVNMLEYLAPIRSRLPIPIAIVVTKSDILPGFAGDDQVTLIRPEEEYLASEEFEIFLERVLADSKLSANPNWSGSVRSVLVRLKDFLRIVLRRTLDFQMFFITCTGQKPEKVGTEVGRSLYIPPAKMQPVGVKEPFYWLLNSIMRNKRISKFRALAKYVVIASVIWMILCSIPYLWHFKVLYQKPINTEESIAKLHNNNLMSANKAERDTIGQAYRRYQRSWLVDKMFTEFKYPAQQIEAVYKENQFAMALEEIDKTIGILASIVDNKAGWPQVKPIDMSIIPNPEHDKLLAVFDKYTATDDSTSELYIKSQRGKEYWNLFIQGVQKPKDEAVWEIIQNQVKQDSTLYWNDLSKEERSFGQALLAVKVEKEKQKAVETATLQLDDLIATINGNPSEDYRLKKAVDTLNKISGNVSAEDAARIRKYINNAKDWNKSRTYIYSIQEITPGWHLHIAISSAGEDPKWKQGELITMIPGREEKIDWKAGDVIYIALDSTHVDNETWGERPRERKLLDGDFSIFKMDGEITFPNTGKSVIIRFKPELKGRLPEL